MSIGFWECLKRERDIRIKPKMEKRASGIPAPKRQILYSSFQRKLSGRDGNPQTYSSFSIPTEMAGIFTYHLSNHTLPTRHAGN